MQATTVKRRGPIEGFIAPDDKHTHGIKEVQVGHFLSWCGRSVRAWVTVLGGVSVNGARRAGRFIANPKHPLCYRCVSAIEDDLRSAAK